MGMLLDLIAPLRYAVTATHLAQLLAVHACVCIVPWLSQNRPVWPKTPVTFACVCMVPWLQHNDKELLLQDVLEGELTFRDGLPGQPSTEGPLHWDYM